MESRRVFSYFMWFWNGLLNMICWRHGQESSLALKEIRVLSIDWKQEIQTDVWGLLGYASNKCIFEEMMKLNQIDSKYIVHVYIYIYTHVGRQYSIWLNYWYCWWFRNHKQPPLMYNPPVNHGINLPTFNWLVCRISEPHPSSFGRNPHSLPARVGDVSTTLSLSSSGKEGWSRSPAGVLHGLVWEILLKENAPLED